MSEITLKTLDSCRKGLDRKKHLLNKRLTAEISALRKEKVPVKVSFSGGAPLISEKLRGLGTFSTEAVGERLSEIKDSLTNGDLMSLPWQLRYTAVTGSEEEGLSALLYSAADVDLEELNLKYNPLCIKYAEDTVYAGSDSKTKALFRFLTSLNSDATGIPEARLSSEYINTAKRSGISVCEVIAKDYRRIFPYTSPLYYTVIQTALAVGITALTILFSNWMAGLAVFTPALALSKALIDFALLKSVRPLPVPSVDLSEAEKYNSVAVMSVLAADISDIEAAVERLDTARIKNSSDNIKYCLLCDLPPSRNKEEPEDKAVIDGARKLSEKKDSPVIIFRHRMFSTTEGKYQGKNRKQGAIEELVRYISGENISFRRVFGDIASIKGAPFIVTLDYDTAPLMDSINALAACALHPVNSDYGIFVPRITTSLSSSLKTVFSRITSGIGGCSTACFYDSRSSELYYDCFGEGTFTGKGLIRTERYYKECTGRIPDERVLSHDIIEGSFLKTAYCGDIEFNDNTPPTSKGWFNRLHRWYRGDIQNYFFLADETLSLLTKFKLSDNIRRVLTDFNAFSALFFSLFSDSLLPVAVVILSVIMPYILALIPGAIKGLSFSNRREFYSPVISLTRNLLSQAFLDIVYLGKNTVVGLDALIRSAVRIITGKNLLRWQTSSIFDRISAIGYSDMILPTLSGVVLFGFSVYYGSISVAIISLFIMSCIPVSIWCDRVTPVFERPIKEKDKELLMETAEKYWSFFTDNVTEENNFLPPDNVQYSPVYRVARRTSPTNIGMYLLSCISAEALGIIDLRKAESLIGNTLATVEALEKYKGNLYNWYATDSLDKLSPFVSSVDSGNFLCCLVAVSSFLEERKGDKELSERIEKIIAASDLSVFYNKSRRLFSVGIDSTTGELMPNCYDMLMSEARMLSYFAIASGTVEKDHWHSLSRIMSRNGYYAGPVAWTGTMFEFFMPELLLESKEGSLCGEAVSYARYCQKKRGTEKGLPFGVSESGYYAFDKELNYQYKAHGVQALALCGGMDEEYVVSPYSSFIAMQGDLEDCIGNVRRLSVPEFLHEKYGLYEAIDFTDSRTGDAVGIIKSHMAHHIGMSIAGIANALLSGELKRLFMKDRRMKRAEELLEEKIMTGEIIIDIEKLRDRSITSPSSEEYREFNIFRPRITLVGNHKLSLFLSDTGLYHGFLSDGRTTAFYSEDYLRRPEGMFFGVREGEREIPFYMTAYDKGLPIDRSVAFGENTAEYYTDFSGIASGMKVSVFGESSAEIREIAIENNSADIRELSFYGYIRPSLDHIRNVRSHPVFSDLFLSAEYDEELSAVFVKRKNRETGKELYMAVGFKEKTDFSRILSRENVLTYNSPLSFSSAAEAGLKDERTIPSPCVYLNLGITLKPSEKFRNSLFIAYGATRNETIGIINDIRSGVEREEPVPPLPKSTLKGIAARKILPSLLYRNVLSEEILGAESGLDKRSLFRFGISGDYPIMLLDYDGDSLKLDTALGLNEGLRASGMENDLVILCRSESEASAIENTALIGRKSVFPLIKDKLTPKEAVFIKKTAVCILGKNEERKPPSGIMETVPCEEGDFFGNEGFRNESYILGKKGHPHSNVLSSRHFGTVLSQNSLGFSYALNSRENKLTPWYNDLMNDNNGEMLLIKGAGKYYDIISGSKAVFSPNKADYYGRVDKLDTEVSVRVFSKGMGKKLTVTVTNPTKTEKKCALSYYVEPVMGADRDSSAYGNALSYRSDERGIYIRNRFNPEFKGEMAIAADRDCYKTTNREAFMAGEQNGEVRTTALPCGALTVKLTVPPEGSETVVFFLAYSRSDARKMVSALEKASCEFLPEKSLTIKSRNDSLNRLFEYWLPWQTLGCRMWARTSFYQNGGAYGYRDQLQDAIAASYFMPKEAKRQILRCCLSQFREGDALHWWHNTNSGRKGVRTACSDDMLWLPFVTAQYCRITGDRSILQIPVRYALGEALGDEKEKYIEISLSEEKESVYKHCKKALEKAFNKGERGLIRIGTGDWNDGYNRVGIKGRGESVWLSMFYVWTVKEFAPLARDEGDMTYADELEKRGAELSEVIERDCFENGYYLRAFYDNGEKMGSCEAEACKLDILPQAFSELSALPDKEKRSLALKKAVEASVDGSSRLIRLFAPAFGEEAMEETGYVAAYPMGIRENGGQYTHGAIWLALALLRSGDRETAERLTALLNPSERGGEYKNEPYYLSADIYTNPECKGRGGWSLYTGSAGWYYILLRELYGEKTK